jgi:hypothetical protein
VPNLFDAQRLSETKQYKVGIKSPKQRSEFFRMTEWQKYVYPCAIPGVQALRTTCHVSRKVRGTGHYYFPFPEASTGRMESAGTDHRPPVALSAYLRWLPGCICTYLRDLPGDFSMALSSRATQNNTVRANLAASSPHRLYHVAFTRIGGLANRVQRRNFPIHQLDASGQYRA